MPEENQNDAAPMNPSTDAPATDAPATEVPTMPAEGAPAAMPGETAS